MLTTFALLLFVAACVGILVWQALRLNVIASARRAALVARRRSAEVGSAEARARVIGTRVAIEGNYRGGEVASSGAVAGATGPSPDVEPVRLADPLLDTPWGAVALEGPLQVVVGALRRHPGETDSLVVRSGDRVLVDGVLEETPVGGDDARVEGAALATYRDREAAYRLVPFTDDAWPRRPIALYRVPPSPRGPALGVAMPSAALVALAFGWWNGSPSPSIAPAAPVVATAATAPPCRDAVMARLAAGDPWTAREMLVACPDPEAQAHTLWLLGDPKAAAEAFERARNGDAHMKPTAAEAEALMIARSPTAPEVLRLLREDWYRGPETAQTRVLGCIGERLLPRLWDPNAAPGDADRGYMAYACIHRASTRSGDVLGGYHIHGLPAYAMHEPTTYLPVYQRTLDNPAMESGFGSSNEERCTSTFPSLTPAAAFSCKGSVLAQRLLFAAMAKDEALYADTLGGLQPFAEIFAALPAVTAGPPTQDQAFELESAQRQYGSAGYSRAEMFKDERAGWIFSLRKIASVAAGAAHHMQDARTRDRFLAFGESHSAGMINEHLRIVRGEDPMPALSHSPSDYSAFEMDLFAKVKELSPQAFRKWLASHGYGNPVRIEAVVHGHPAHLAEIAEWNREGYLPLARGPSLLQLLHRTFERRRVAELSGDALMAKRLALVGRGLSSELTASPPAVAAVFAFESVVLLP